MTVVVSIGANIGGEHMDKVLGRPAWADYRYEVGRVVRRYCGTPYFEGSGLGWSVEWGIEEAHTIVAPDIMADLSQEDFEEELSNWAGFFQQEAVAVTYGTTKFVP